MISRCSAASAVRHFRNASPASFFCTATSGSSEESSIALAASSSSSTSLRRRTKERALNRPNCQEPGGNGGSAFKLAGLAPHIEKDLADKIFRDLFVPNEPQPETEHPDSVPSVQ